MRTVRSMLARIQRVESEMQPTDRNDYATMSQRELNEHVARHADADGAHEVAAAYRRLGGGGLPYAEQQSLQQEVIDPWLDKMLGSERGRRS